MFGYVKTDNPNMYVKDTVLYRSMYCGLCKSIGRSCGQKARFALNYDLTFLSIFMHNILDIDVKIEKQRCVVHWLRKRPVAVPDLLSDRIGALNIILAYHKINDDVSDVGKGKIKRAFFKSSYKKALQKEPELDAIVKKRFQTLWKYEKENNDSIDMVADPFGNLMVDIVKNIAGEVFDENLQNLSYNLGKWIYLIDALDDFDDDKKKNNYNVFANAYKDAEDKNQLISNYKQELEFIFGETLLAITQSAKKLNYKFNHDLTDNILLFGLKLQTKMVMENKKCKNTTKF